MHQFLGFHMKGVKLMVCENLFKLYGTSSEELRNQATKQADNFYLPQIEKLTETVDTLTTELHQAKQLLAKHNIAY